jgi:hypothetical protein
MRTVTRSRRVMFVAGLSVLAFGLSAGPATANFQTPGTAHTTDTGKALEGSDSDFGGNPGGVVVADFNDDGQDDLAGTTSERHGPESRWRFHSGLSVALSQTDGSYGPPVYYPFRFHVRSYALPGTPRPLPNLCCVLPWVGPGATDPLAVDVNGDDLPDLVVANPYGDSVAVLLNTGGNSPENPEAIQGTASAGVFGAPTVYPLERDPQRLASESDNQPVSVAAADLDGDGDHDLVTANRLSNDVSVLLNVGGGMYRKSGSYSVGSRPTALATGDLNNDGKPDVVTANSTSNDVSVLFNQGGSELSADLFGTETAYAINASSDEPVGIATANLDGNANASEDVVTANGGSNDVSVLLSDASGALSLEAGSPYGVGTRPVDVVLADLDGDRDRDAATANSGSDDISVLANDGSASFTVEAQSPYAASGGGPASVAPGDLDPDGSGDVDPDLGVATSGTESVTILANQ